MATEAAQSPNRSDGPPSGKYYLNEYVSGRPMIEDDPADFKRSEHVTTLGEFESFELAARERLETYVERERNGAPPPGPMSSPELYVQEHPSDSTISVNRPQDGGSRIEIAPGPDGDYLCTHDLARRQGLHYMERWPVLRLDAGLGQPEEQLNCLATVLTPNGVVVIREACHDEGPYGRAKVVTPNGLMFRKTPHEPGDSLDADATRKARDANAARDLRLRSALRERLSEQGCSRAICKMPIHVMTVSADEKQRPFEPSAVSRGGSDVLKITAEGCSLRCLAAGSSELALLDLAASQSKRLPSNALDKVQDALMPDLPVSRSNPSWQQQILSFAVGQSELQDPLYGRGTGFDSPGVPGELRGEAAALRTLVRAVDPWEDAQTLEPITLDDLKRKTAAGHGAESADAAAKGFLNAMKALKSQGLLPDGVGMGGSDHSPAPRTAGEALLNSIRRTVGKIGNIGNRAGLSERTADKVAADVPLPSRRREAGMANQNTDERAASTRGR